MKYVKAINGHVSLHGNFIREGGVHPFENEQIDNTVDTFVERGLVKVFDTHKEAASYVFVPLAVKAEQSLPTLNPGQDKDGKDLPVDTPQVDMLTGEPTEKGKEATEVKNKKVASTSSEK